MIRNFRDLSQYKNKQGKSLPKGKFLRSAALVDLTEKDIKRLEKYRPLTVIDLRTPTEKKEKPDYRFDRYEEISLIDDSAAGITHDKKSRMEMLSKLPDMRDLYAGFIRNEISVEGLRRVFEIINDPDWEGAILWHCTEGKDRCGIVTALFLKMMDYDDKTILRDYLKSAKSSRWRGLKYYWLIRIFVKNKAAAQVVKDAYSVKKEYLESAYREIDKRYGSMDAFLEYIRKAQL